MRATAVRLLAAPPRPPGRRPAASAPVDWWADPQVWLNVGKAVALIAVAAGAACVIVRFLLPPVLHALIEPVQEAISVLAIAVLLPEFALTTAMRGLGRQPPRVAYDFGDSVSWSARVVRGTLHSLLRISSHAARQVHPTITAVIAGGIALGRTAGLW